MVTQTVSDWLARAKAAEGAAEVEQHLAAATALAASFHDWRTLLLGIAELPLASRQRLVDATNRTLALARTEREVWGFRDVARIRADNLADVPGARAALEAAVRVFGEPDTGVLGRAAAVLGDVARTPGYVWVLLGKGFVDVLGDADGLRRCLEAGRDSARAAESADDLCSIATEWARHVDRDAGIALLVEAEAMARDGSAQPWTLANAWKDVGDDDAVHRVLSAALRDAGTSGEALHVVKAWGSHGKSDEARAALSRAQALATTFEDWLAIAEVALDARMPHDVPRQAVERAEGLARDDEARGRVSRAYQQWLGDEAAATRVGPRGIPPEALRARVRYLPGWQPSASALFDWLRARISPESLATIAAADYGADTPKHLAALRDLCDTGLVPRRLAWEPHEVLALTRWSAGENVDHLARALSCTLLSLVPDGTEELATNGPILVESALVLGDEARARAEQLMAWYYETEPPADQGGEDTSVPLLLLLLLCAAADPLDARIDPLVGRIVDGETDRMSASVSGGMRADLWRELLGRILAPLADARPNVELLLAGLGLPP